MSQLFTSLSIFDFLIIFFLIFATCLGFFFGAIRVVGNLATIIVSIFLAGIFSKILAPLFAPYLLNNNALGKVAAFVVVYWFVSLFLSLAVEIANKIFNLPLLKTVNRLGGGLVAFFGSIVVMAVFFYFFQAYAWSSELPKLLSESRLVPFFIWLGKYISIAIPGI
ncbi:MAG: hypothetical protein A2445_04250 [Candidatus Jacksonbacteria bacterium RIFOXYC2_FULL_44_29]|nr:MAG: Colicin V production protein [Parcubacteria group bacterium GW2011_GWA2_42_28]KKT56199.1 MAG: Colicin V production protein [Parcubacteria group bacterium GW2011_GWC2_44_22]OGY76149.1 MAG: hypothetical protein A2240_00470 [Candidatus Jacksonbacteria bacterium RIFOXYA2_FULL_43_12]OGY77739.1 MAG: hypothetical protein A2295_02970 [Candidatus Jacksonbacteria bacterium RIFOXYB2_FULL_44_15]OGY78876.1 MAG: hypothetical protein A2550_05035 [Candidatus Jacksonbacteria bacterium RIFOXYD2_FULL_43_2